MHESVITEKRKQYSETEKQKLKEDCHKTYQEVSDFFNKFNYTVSTNCRNVLSNLTSMMHPEYFNPLTEDDSVLEEIDQCLACINEYYRLLDTYPEFAKRELAEGHGYFDQARLRDVRGGAKAHIEAYKAWLAEEFSSADTLK